MKKIKHLFWERFGHSDKQENVVVEKCRLLEAHIEELHIKAWQNIFVSIRDFMEDKQSIDLTKEGFLEKVEALFNLNSTKQIVAKARQETAVERREKEAERREKEAERREKEALLEQLRQAGITPCIETVSSENSRSFLYQGVPGKRSIAEVVSVTASDASQGNEVVESKRSKLDKTTAEPGALNEMQAIKVNDSSNEEDARLKFQKK